MGRHFAFVNIQRPGHLFPTLEVVRELIRRGHRVTYPAVAERAELIAGTGAEAPIYQSTITAATAPPPEGVNRLTFMRARIVTETAFVLPQLCEFFAGDPPDAVVHDRMVFAGRLLAEKLKRPAVHLIPSFAANEHWSLEAQNPAPSPDSPELRRYHELLNALLESHGLSHLRDRLGESRPAKRVVFVPRQLQPKGETFDHRWDFVGPCLGWRPGNGKWEPPSKERPMLLIAMGGTRTDLPDFYRECAAAFGDSRWQVVLVTGRCEDLDQLPSNFQAHQWVPQLEALKHTDVLLCHGGMGSTLEALHFGVPLVHVPLTPEQRVNAARVAELGLGVTVLEPSAPALRAAVEEVTADPGVPGRLAQMRQHILDSGGATRAADVIESAIAPEGE